MNRSVIFRRLVTGALLLFVLGGSFLAQAQEKKGFHGIPITEVAMLPPYCQDRLNSKRNQEKWVGVLGHNGWIHLHHYCYGLVHYYRAGTALDFKNQAVHAQKGIGQFNYVMRNWPADYQLYQQAKMYKQQLQVYVQ